MHAAIVADTLRVPWLAVASSPQVSTFKWLDWTGSMGLPYEPASLRASSTEMQLRNAMLWAYGQTHRFDDHRDETALGYYARRYGRATTNGHRTVRKLGRRVHRAAERWLSSPRLTRWRARRDEIMVEHVAADLARLARQPGMLSDDTVFRQRVEVLSARLAAVAAEMRGAA
jgi:succinoglycan biosynthesis protein ExoV